MATRVRDPGKRRVLVVDDEASLRALVRTALEGRGYEVSEARDGNAAIRLLDGEYFDAMLLDLRMPEADGWAVLDHMRTMPDHPITLMMSAYGDIPTALDAVRRGAVDFVEKPFKMADLVHRIDGALGGAKSQKRVASQGAVIESAAMRKCFELADRVAATPASSAFIFGESGAGKEIVSTRIHERSARHGGPFVRVNLAALPDSMIEAELFGSVRGAFTDAKRDRAGILASAQGGTLLLDEITEFRIDLQPKLLRVLEERRFFPVGSDRDRPFDVRVLAATNRDPQRAVAEGRMRADLFYRLATVLIEVPPLRQREDDLIPLAEHFLAWFAAEFGRGAMTLSPDAVMAIYSHHWPGNVRELRNVVERAVIACDGHSVTAKHLGIVAPPKSVRAPPLMVAMPQQQRIPTSPSGVPIVPAAPAVSAGVPVVPAAPLPARSVGATAGSGKWPAAPAGPPSVLPDGRPSLMPGISLAPPSGPPVKLEEARAKALETVERKQIEKAMRVARGNRTAAAEILGISRSTLWEKLKQYGLLDK